jgi:hypothetical protein
MPVIRIEWADESSEEPDMNRNWLAETEFHERALGRIVAGAILVVDQE